MRFAVRFSEPAGEERNEARIVGGVIECFRAEDQIIVTKGSLRRTGLQSEKKNERMRE